MAQCELSAEMKVMYDRSTDFWKLLHKVFSKCADGQGVGRKAMRNAQVRLTPCPIGPS